MFTKSHQKKGTRSFDWERSGNFLFTVIQTIFLYWKETFMHMHRMSVSYGYCLNIHCKTSKQTYWKCYCKKRATGSLMPKLFFPQITQLSWYPGRVNWCLFYYFSSPLSLLDNSHCFFRTSHLLPHQFSKISFLSFLISSEFPFFPALLYMYLYLYLYQIHCQVSQLRISIHWLEPILHFPWPFAGL